MSLNSIDPTNRVLQTGQAEIDADDGTLDALVLSNPVPMGDSTILAVGLPSSMRQQHVGGRYFLARCGAQTPDERWENWQIYLRRPLFACRLQPQFLNDGHSQDGDDAGDTFDRWDLLIPPGDDPGFRWLRQLAPGSSVNLIGPRGQGFSLSSQTRNLLVLTEPARMAALLPTIDSMLDQNGRVTLILTDTQRNNPTPLLAQLPLSVEVQLAHSFDQWRQQLDDSVQWADQICASIPRSSYLTLAETIRHRRFRLEPDFAQMLVEADLACGTGACLACVVPSANGSVTRACVHGPVMDLSRLVAR